MNDGENHGGGNSEHPVPLVLGAVAFVCTTAVHALPLGATVNFIRREKSRGRAGASFWVDVTIVARTISYATAAHLIEVGLWALLFVTCGEFRAFGSDYYHSAVNYYTTLAYGDIVMSPAWRLLGPRCSPHTLLDLSGSVARDSHLRLVQCGIVSRVAHAR